MKFIDSFKKSLFSTNEHNFNERALELFRFQAENNDVYKKYLNALQISPANIKDISSIPFLPIDFFKKHKVIIGNKNEQVLFKSSGTTGQERSTHYVVDPDFYKAVSERIFQDFYGSFNDCTLLVLLPSYQENKNSSLIFMIDNFIAKTAVNGSKYLFSMEELVSTVTNLPKIEKKIVLWGVSYALLDFAENHFMDFSRITVLETGGMKGRREELTREQLHQAFKEHLKVDFTHSEYGMTELLSQAYSMGNGIFSCPSWMKICIREVQDPFTLAEIGKVGGINIIDFANVESCAFIETKDLGIIYEDGRFEVRGRMDNSDIRGCNLLYLA